MYVSNSTIACRSKFTHTNAPGASRLRISANGPAKRTAARSAGMLRLILIGVTMLVCFGFGALVHSWSGENEVQAASVQAKQQIIVKPGDTLWSIAEAHAPQGSDIRQYMQKLKKANELKTGSLRAGQVLVLP